MNAALLLTHATTLLQQARERVAHGCPSLALALAGTPYSTALARLQEAEAARYEPAAQPWALALTEAMVLLEEAREAWGAAPDVMPVMTAGLAPCGRELRMYLPAARACAEVGVAWEDPGGLTRPQTLCVAHLAICLAQWRALEMHAETAAAQARASLERERKERAAEVAKVIWTPKPKPPAPESRNTGPRSLRDLASVASAFDQWGDEENDDA